MGPSRPFRVTATGEIFDGGPGAHMMVGARLATAAAGGTCVLRETDGSGTVLAELTAPANGSDEVTIPVTFTRKIHATLVGVGATAMVYIA